VNPWRLPFINRFSLASGLTVWLIERKDLPIVSLRLVFAEGGIEDPPSMAGTAHLTGTTIDTGTTSRSALDISGALERLGSSYQLHTVHDGTTVSLATLTRNFRQSLEILADILAHPTFPDEEIERKRTLYLTSIAQQKDRASTLASWAFHRLAYGASHPYGTDVGGTERTVKGISRSALVEYSHNHFAPDACTAIIGGPVVESECRALLEENQFPWTLKRESCIRRQVPPPESHSGVFVIDRPGSAQAEIRLGHPSLKRNSQDFFPIIIMNRILGGQFSSRLNANLRERRGYTYGAWSTFGFGRLGGPFVAGTAVNTADTGAALEELIREIDGIGEGNVTAEELAFAVEGIAGGFALMFETPAQTAAVLQNIIFYQLGEEYYSTYLETLRSVTLGQVNAAARKYLHTSEMTIAIAGDAEKILPVLGSSRRAEVVTLEELGL
jgi:zinc protease